ncbi:ParB N-terminal domain-containing protein [Candidatus Woesebacteria bacterium]|nr:ParB N-terminal domain-containing protein [Candidatus Woesebacteria bacterium]
MQTPPVIHYIPISELNPAPYNPRTWDEEALKQLCESINKFGFLDPVIANNHEERKNVVIGGHMRLAAAKNLAWNKCRSYLFPLPMLNEKKNSTFV